jgi:hypothetical protein
MLHFHALLPLQDAVLSRSSPLEVVQLLVDKCPRAFFERVDRGRLPLH